MTTEIVLACRPVRIEDYPPDRQALWERIRQETNAIPPIYPGSSYKSCAACGIEVVIGPRQQEALTMPVRILCIIDAVIAATEPGVESTVASLGNPYQAKK